MECRFQPTCTEALLKGLGDTARQYVSGPTIGDKGPTVGDNGPIVGDNHGPTGRRVLIHSHISESVDQVAFTHALAEHHHGSTR